MVDSRGLSGAARFLNISRSIIQSGMAGIGIRRGSIELLREALSTQRKAALQGEEK